MTCFKLILLLFFLCYQINCRLLNTCCDNSSCTICLPLLPSYVPLIPNAPENIPFREWLCPVDTDVRPEKILYGNVQSLLPPIACENDEECASIPFKQKCCYDIELTIKVCKPAI